MANKNRTKRAMLLSVLSLIMCFSMFVGTTYAWFTDSVTSAKNKIVAGTLDVELKYQNALVDEWTSVEGKSNIFDPNAIVTNRNLYAIPFNFTAHSDYANTLWIGVNNTICNRLRNRRFYVR